MEDELRTKIEKIVNQSEIKESIEDIIREILESDGDYEISITSKDGKTSEIRMEGRRIALKSGLMNLLDEMIKKDIINLKELDIIFEILKERN